ncbi:chemotaxis protein [Rhizobium calliandrae]|uniref:Chemotaxis protein n=2 Tax=Rhizobium calliandrae TaxID=1312182 RepID=A0ABT7KAC5_9HYPH|nr:chemotaxis protein [Rhizobium calliandrae]MDL2405570.1 chemotaxis protein [Rhizobium calliandrae]
MDVSRILEAARTEVEKRFLDGGTVLLSVMEVLNQLLSSLDRLTKALDSDGASDTTADLLQTVSGLSDLPGLEARRQANFEVLAEAGSKLHAHVTDMQETMRYLRTFAITVKITGAGIAEFAGFAQEILERIHSGTDEVNTFAQQLGALERELKVAMTFGATTARAYDRNVPQVVAALEKDARTIAAHRKELAVNAAEVGAIARGVQSKVATTLSALQIGDITRQRIEHVQSSFTFLEEYLASDEGSKLDADARQRLANVIHHLTAAQMREMVADFQRESGNVVKTIASFSHDTQEILKLRDAMKPEGSSDGNVLRALEQSVSAAHTIVKQVETARVQADGISQSTLGTASNLLGRIETIRAVKTDIHYMALNTNLRCSRMGEEGRSINVVTAELRIFAAKLDESADAMVTGLASLEKAAGHVASGQEGSDHRLDERLISAVDTIRCAANIMDGELEALSGHGREVANKIMLSIGKLDFQRDLGETLANCADRLGDMAGSEMAEVNDLEDIIVPLGARIFKVYTMAQERNIHRDIIAMDDRVAPAVAAPAKTDDDDLFADALF